MTIAISFFPMMTSTIELLSHDDNRSAGPPVVLLPGAGDIRSGYGSLAERLGTNGYRVVTADLPGHGDSPTADSYGVAETARALGDLIDSLEAGPATVIGTSFSPAATVWAAATRPHLIRAVVAISPHMEAEPSPAAALQRLAILTLLRGPWAGALWGRLYRSWFKTNPPDDLERHVARLQAMLTDRGRRRAVRETLVAHRKGMAEMMERFDRPSLIIFGSADDHFPDPAAEADRLSRLLDGQVLMVEGAGHYPYMEYPTVVEDAVLAFLDSVG